ncbi:hypothetical protein GIB67_008410 [Kingdonia uniflora]|uniref:RNA-binding protein NOB1 n=1 Tax=Kingdonia uniflora TaxID=39325 RepID=A0A7J7N507_9MAGN|nr:hypothetical protein GIB67_008410 [Kingdonia uniflora]
MESTTPCWSTIVQQRPPPNPHEPAKSQLFETCKSNKGIAVAIVDANAIIQGGEKLNNCADKFVSVTEVVEEVRDPVSRHRLQFLPFTLETKEPSPEALKKVTNFARATGDIQTLSDVDLKLIALTYTLEAQIHGTSHLRDSPPPIQLVNTKKLSEKEMPGWGNNVPNLAEWEALENAVEVGSNANSRILALRDLNLNTVPVNGHVYSEGSLIKNVVDARVEDQVEVDTSLTRPRKYMPIKKDINIEGKMLANGVDASHGQVDEADDWLPAVSRSTHRRFLRRKARRELSAASSEKDDHHDLEEHENLEELQDVTEVPEEGRPKEGDIGNADLLSILKQMNLEMDSSIEVKDNSNNINVEAGDEVEVFEEGIDNSEIASEADETVDASFVDDCSSEQSWMLRSLSESSVACVTSDYAMQNVILQIGLRLLAPGGMQIHELHRWILRCHACNKVTAETERIFCPKCGNGGTLRKVSVSVSENGVVLAARKPRIILQGTKYSLPLPRGGREAITKNVVLREDQVSRKDLNLKSKKKLNKQGDDMFASDDVFSRSNKKAPLKPPVRQALAIFSGKRNPNDNHYSRSMH